MARHPKGSSPKLTLKLIEEISLLLKKGCYVETAAAACGISKDTFYRWLRKGKNDELNTLEKKLSDAIMVSMAESEVRDLEILEKAAQGTPDVLDRDEEGNVMSDSAGRPIVLEYGLAPNWKVSAWRLERKFPSKWGRRVKIETTIEDSSITIEFVEP